jgi:modulator of FtsH protease
VGPLDGWSTFFSTEAEAAATLTGLLFVAVSINLSRILQYPHLPNRAVEALIELAAVLVVSTFGLVPRQSLEACGIEIGATGVVMWAALTVLIIRSPLWLTGRAIRIVLNQLPPLAFIAAGVVLVLGHPGGVYLVVPATLLAFLGGIFGAWVLLVEIQR